MNKLLWRVAVALLVLVAGMASVRIAYPTLVPRLLGTGGFVQKVVQNVPHPFAFESPRFWVDESSDWQVLLLGPPADDGVILANLVIRVRPAAGRDAEDPEPAGPLSSLDDFARRYLPREYSVSSGGQATVDGRAARDVTYRYVAYGGAAEGPATKMENCRGRAVLFEDRGYYYMLAYTAGDTVFNRYAEILDRALTTFRFLN